MKKLTLPRLRSLAPQPQKKVRKLAANAAHRLTAPPYDDYEEEPTTKLSTAFVVVLILHLVAVGGIYAFHSIKKHRHGAEAGQAAETSVSGVPAVAPKASSPASNPSGPGSVAGSASGVNSVGGNVAMAAQTGSGVVPQRPLSSPSAVGAPVTGAVGGAKPGVMAAGSARGEGAAAGGGASVGTLNGAHGGLALKNAPVAGGSVVPGGGSSGKPESAPATASPKTYTVQKGDNPVAIAKKLGVSYDELLKLNGIEDPKKLQIGQMLKVPVKKGAL